MSFLLLVPLFSLIWQFFVYPKISESLKSYYAQSESRPSGDMGASLALTICICSLVSFVPFIGHYAALAAFVVMIIFFVRVFELSRNLA